MKPLAPGLADYLPAVMRAYAESGLRIGGSPAPDSGHGFQLRERIAAGQSAPAVG